jgi:hypothetical protein
MAVNKMWPLLLLLSFSCTHAPVEVLPGDCTTRAVFVSRKGDMSYTIKHEYWSFTKPQSVLLSKILKDGPHQCQVPSEIDWEFKQNYLDVLLSLFPFASRGQVILNYNLE